MTRMLVVAGTALLLLAVGCSEPEWHPSESSLPAIEEPGLWDADDMRYDQVDDPESAEQGRVQKATGAPQVIYSNFSDGTTTLIKSGFTSDNAPKNQSFIRGGVQPKWSGDEARAKIVQAQFQSMMNDFNVVLAAKRPMAAPYSMIMIGGGGGGGVAPVDCNNRNPNNVCFDDSSKGSVVTMAQEIGHTFGLAHNDVACDVMGASYTSKKCTTGKWGFIDMDGPVLGGSSACVGSTQNSYQVMKKVLGAWPGGAHPDPMGDGSSSPCGDMAPPSVKFLEPADGAAVPNDFTVKAEAMDDCGLKEVKIELPAQMLTATASTAPFQWNLTGIGDAAKLEIRLTATDASGKTGAPTSIFVKVGSGSGKDGGGGTGGGGTGGGGQSGDSGNGGAAGGSAGGPGVQGGCSLALAAPTHPGGSRTLAVVVIALGRARRRLRSSRPSPQSGCALGGGTGSA